MNSRRQSHRLSWITRLGLAGMILIAVLVAADLGFGAWIAGRVYPGVTVAGVALGNKTRAEAREILAQRAADYRVTVKVEGRDFPATAADLGTTFDSEATTVQAYDVGRGHISALIGLMDSLANHSDISYSYAVDRNTLKDYVTKIVTSIGQAPVDAQVVVKSGVPTVLPDKPGRSVSSERLTQLVEDSMQQAGAVRLEMTAAPLAADVQATSVTTAVATTQQLVATPITLTYSGKIYTPNAAQIGDWLAFEKTNIDGHYLLEPKVDSTKLKDYLQNLANGIDVAPTNQQVTVKNGVSQTDVQGVNGLAVDQDAAGKAITVALTTKTPLAYTLTTKDVPFKTITNQVVTLDLGRYIEVNLSTQHLWVYQDHNVIYESPITSGATGAGLGTVTGLFSIYYKTTNTRLRGYQYGYDYDVPVKYWMPFYQGYGLHDAVWRNGKFGGPDYYYGGSHGCVNLPDDTAAFIYNWADVGTPVWVHK